MNATAIGRCRGYWAVLAGVMLLTGSQAWAVRVPWYHVINLGTLGGSSSAGYDINSAGEVVGSSNLPGNTASHAFRYSGGSMQDLGTLGGATSYARGINDLGQVTGGSRIDGTSTEHAFLVAGGGMIDLGTGGGTGSGAYDINNSGQIVGWMTTPIYHAFLYSAGTMTDLWTMGGTSSWAYAINNVGQVVGFSGYSSSEWHSHPFIWANSLWTDLGTFGGANGYAEGINDAGQVAGYSAPADESGFHAFLYSEGSKTDLGSLGGSGAEAYDINSSAQIVGMGRILGEDIRAFVYMNGTMYDLNDRHGPCPGFQYMYKAQAINDAGIIVANAYIAGNSRACKLVPNALPVAASDSYTAGIGETLTVPAATGVLSNDADDDAAAFGQTLTAAKLTDPGHGTLTAFGADGSFTYVPTPGYEGPDSFTYKISDGLEDGASNATVSILLSNRPPPDPASVSIAATPSPAVVSSELKATAVSGGADPDGDTVSFKYQWALLPAGAPSVGRGTSREDGLTWGHDSTDGILTGVTLHKGEQWKARACADDGVTEASPGHQSTRARSSRADSGWVESEAVTIGNSAPTVPGADDRPCGSVLHEHPHGHRRSFER